MRVLPEIRRDGCLPPSTPELWDLSQFCFFGPLNGRCCLSHPAKTEVGSQPAAPIVFSLQDSQLDSLPFRFAAMDNFYPKVLQHPDNGSSGSSDNFSKTREMRGGDCMERGGGVNLEREHGRKAELLNWPTDSSDFERHRKTHYNEGKFLVAQKNQPSGNKKKSNGGSGSLGTGGRGAMLGPEARPVGRGWAGGLAGGVKDKIGLVTRSHVQGAEG